MNDAAMQLRRLVEACELRHVEFATHLNALKRRVDDTLVGLAPRIEWLIGPSRVGKSKLIDSLASMYPMHRENNRRSVPVLVVPIPPAISPKLLPISVLTELGVPLPQRGLASGVMVNRMADQLRLAGTRVLIFEEASHLVEPGSKVLPRAAGDWMKAVHDDLNVSILLIGVPRLRRLFEANEQLRLRASSAKEFRPYRWNNVAECTAFSECVFTFARLFEEAGWPIAMTRQQLVGHCYLLSGGLIGLVARFMQELAAKVTDIAPRPLTMVDCLAAVKEIESVKHPNHSPFVNEVVTPVECNQVHGYVLEMNGMGALPSIT